jgi:hypothetical protein
MFASWEAGDGRNHRRRGEPWRQFEQADYAMTTDSTQYPASDSILQSRVMLAIISPWCIVVAGMAENMPSPD